MQQLNLQTMAEGESSLNIHEVASERAASTAPSAGLSRENGRGQKVFQAEGVTLKLCRQAREEEEKEKEEEKFDEEEPQSGSRTSLGRKMT